MSDDKVPNNTVLYYCGSLLLILLKIMYGYGSNDTLKRAFVQSCCDVFLS